MVNFNGRTDSSQVHDAESLRQIVVTVRELLAPAIRLAGDPDVSHSKGQMQAAGVHKLEIKYIQSLERAMRELSRWGAACESAWTKKRISTTAAPSAPAAKPARAAKPAKPAKPAKSAKPAKAVKKTAKKR